MKLSIVKIQQLERDADLLLAWVDQKTRETGKPLLTEEQDARGAAMRLWQFLTELEKVELVIEARAAGIPPA